MAEPAASLRIVLACPSCGHELQLGTFPIHLQLAEHQSAVQDLPRMGPSVQEVPESTPKTLSPAEVQALEPHLTPAQTIPQRRKRPEGWWEQHREAFLHPCAAGCGRYTHRRWKLCPACRRSGQVATEQQAADQAPLPSGPLPSCDCPEEGREANEKVCRERAPLGVWVRGDGSFTCRLFEQGRSADDRAVAQTSEARGRRGHPQGGMHKCWGGCGRLVANGVRRCPQCNARVLHRMADQESGA